MAHDSYDCDHRREVINQLKSLLDEIANETSPKSSPVCYGRPCCIQLDSKKPSPDVMVCYKCKDKPDDKQSSKTSDPNDPKPKTKVETCKSRELLGGVLYLGCDCEKRNGLQDDCKRRQCQGSPACLTKPPTCCPSQYSNAKHLMKKMLQNKKKRPVCDDNKSGGSSSTPNKSSTSPVKKDCITENYICYPAIIQCCGCH